MADESLTLLGPSQRRVNRFPPPLAALLVLALGLLAAWFLDGIYREIRGNEERRAVAQQAAPYGNAISLAINRRVALVAGLRAFVELAGEPFTGVEFDAYAAALAASAPGIRTVQYIEGGVIRHTFPEEGNRAAIGLDLARHPDAMIARDFLRAAATSSLVLSGPTELAQGGVGLIARQAVGPARRERQRLVALVLDLAPVLDEARLDQVSGIRLALRDDAGRVIFGTDPAGSSDPAEIPVALFDRHWTLAASPAAGWGAAARGDITTFRVGAGLVAVLFALITHLILSRQASLATAVDERTESLMAANRRLEEQVEQRELAEAQVQHMQKMEGLGRLAGGIAHDFNNILTGILGYVGLLQENLAPGTGLREDVDEIDRAARRAADLTRQLLTFARRQAVTLSVVDLNVILREVERILQRLIGEDVEMTIDLEDPGWSVLMDRTQVEQILTNLVVNARDAMPGGGSIMLRTRNVQYAPDRPELGHSLKVRDFVRLDVQDTGTGMDSETAARIFEPFFTTKGPGKGTGLGLAICYGIVQQAGGEVSVVSAPRGGTTISIYLPRADRPAESALPDVVPDPTPGHETVLLVEDEDTVRKFAARALGERGHPVLVAPDGHAALRIAAQHQGPISLLVTDIVMPRMGGRLVAEQLGAMRPGIRTLFISGHVDDPRVREAVAADDAAFLAKPFTARELIDAVRNLLD